MKMTVNENYENLFFDSILSSLRVRNISEIKSRFGPSCIIDNPTEKLTNPYLGYNILDNVNKVIEAVDSRPSGRTKPVVVTIRGTGGGKTRLLEELRHHLNVDTNTLVVAITFNCDSEY